MNIKEYEPQSVKFFKKFKEDSKPIEIKSFNGPKEFTIIQLENELPRGTEETNKFGNHAEIVIEVSGTEIKSNPTITSRRKILSPLKNLLRDDKSRNQERNLIIGTCRIHLEELSKKEGNLTEWPLYNDSSKVGSVSLMISFENEQTESPKSKICRMIVQKILKDLTSCLQDAVSHAGMEGVVNDDFSPGDDFFNSLDYDSITKTVKFNVQHCIEISGEKDSMAYENIEIYHNETNLGSLSPIIASPVNNSIPIESYTEDTITLYSIRRGEIIRKILVQSISWKEGESMLDCNPPVYITLKSSIDLSHNKNTISVIKIMKKLLLVLYYLQLRKVHNIDKVFKWDGRLENNMKNILAILCTYCSPSQWKALTSWTLFGIRLLVPMFSNKLLNEKLKTISDIGTSRYSEQQYGFELATSGIFSLELYEKECLQVISDFEDGEWEDNANNENGYNYIEEVQCVTDSLIMLQKGEDIDDIWNKIKTKLHPLVGRQVRKKLLEVISNDPIPTDNIQSCSKVLENYEKLFQTILAKFGNFGYEVWCPCIAMAVIQNLWPRVEGYLNHVRSNVDPTSKQVNDYTIQIYTQIKSLFRYVPKDDSEFKNKEEIFYQKFEVWIPYWLSHVKSKGEEQIKRADEMKQSRSSTETLNICDKFSYQRSFSLSIVDEIENAKDVVEIMHRCIQSWKEIFKPYHKRGDISLQFLEMLHDLFLFYVSRLNQNLLSDKEFFPPEYSRVTISMFHVKYKYLDDFFEKEMSNCLTEDEKSRIEENVGKMKLEVKQSSLMVTENFCKFQKRYFKLYLEDPKSFNQMPEVYRKLNPEASINGHIRGLLEFLRGQKMAYANIDMKLFSEKLDRSFLLFVTSLFETQEKVIIKYHEKLLKKRYNLTFSKGKKPFSADPTTFQRLLSDVKECNNLREYENITESQSLINIEIELSFMFESSLALISNYLGLICKTEDTFPKDSSSGVIRYIVGRVNDRIHIHLKNFSLNSHENSIGSFKIKVNLLPIISDTYTSFIGESTKVYHDVRTIIFDLEEDDQKHKFEFDVTEKIKQGKENNNIIQYLELIIYDISSSMEVLSWKHFRGHILHPLNEKIRFFENNEDFKRYSQTSDELHEKQFVCTESLDTMNNNVEDDNIQSQLILAYNELKFNRKENFVGHFIKHRESQYFNCRSKTRITNQ